MGKKKVLQQNEAALIKETSDIEHASKKVFAGAAVNRLAKAGKVYIQATYNNTIISIADQSGGIMAWGSAGSLGFKGAKKATPYAASRVADTVVEKVKKSGLQEVDIFVKGVGGGRESAVRSIANHGLNIKLITDVTPLPHNGCRPPKVRRV